MYKNSSLQVLKLEKKILLFSQNGHDKFEWGCAKFDLKTTEYITVLKLHITALIFIMLMKVSICISSILELSSPSEYE